MSRMAPPATFAELIAYGGPDDGSFDEAGGPLSGDALMMDDESGAPIYENGGHIYGGPDDLDEDGGPDFDDEDGGPDEYEVVIVMEDGGPKKKLRKKTKNRNAAKKRAAAIKKALRRGRASTRRGARGCIPGGRQTPLSMSFGCSDPVAEQLLRLQLAQGMTGSAAPGRAVRSGVRFISMANAMPYATPVPLNAVVDPNAVAALMRSSGAVLPSQGVVKSATVTSATAFGIIQGSDIQAKPATNPGSGFGFRCPFVGVRTLFGQPGLNSASGAAIQFSVYTSFWGTTAGGAATSATTIPTASGSNAEATPTEDSFSSGTFNIGVQSTTCVAEVDILTYQVVNGQANVKQAAVSYVSVWDGKLASPALGYAERGIALDVASGATSSGSYGLHLITPNTMEWQALYNALTRKVRWCK